MREVIGRSGPRPDQGEIYEQIPDALTAPKGAYLADPSDPITTAHIDRLPHLAVARRLRL